MCGGIELEIDLYLNCTRIDFRQNAIFILERPLTACHHTVHSDAYNRGGARNIVVEWTRFKAPVRATCAQCSNRQGDTYLWSPGPVPKPKDWGPEIDIVG